MSRTYRNQVVVTAECAAKGQRARIIAVHERDSRTIFHVALVDAPFRINDFYFDADEVQAVRS